MNSWIPAITGITGAIIGAVGAYVALRKDRREARTQVVTEAEKTVEFLEKQNKLLEDSLAEAKLQGERREAEWLAREQEWKQERDELRKRVSDVERDYRNMVLTVTTMGFCANSASCANYNPGDRRTHTKE